MNALIIFEAANEHPLAGLLDKRHRHVWVAIKDDERNAWTSYNWRDGSPLLRLEGPADFDLSQHYIDQGLEVIAIQTNPDYRPVGPMLLNNCVGHVKLICGIKSWALTPHQLYKHLTATLRSPFFALWTIPGGGPSAPPAVTPTGFRYKTEKTGFFTSAAQDQGGSKLRLSTEDFNVRKAEQAKLQQVATANRGNGGSFDKVDYTKFREETTRTLEAIPGYTSAGPDTAAGFPNDPFRDQRTDAERTASGAPAPVAAPAPAAPAAVAAVAPPPVQQAQGTSTATAKKRATTGGTAITPAALVPAQTTTTSLLG